MVVSYVSLKGSKGEFCALTQLEGYSTSDPFSELTLIERLGKAIMGKFTFATTTKDEEIFCYDASRGIYSPNCEWLIKEQCRSLRRNIKIHEINEVINYIKNLTYMDRSKFDSDPDLINFRNGILNIHTLRFREHSPDQHFLSMVPHDYIPIFSNGHYNEKAQCPTIVKFLHEALKTTEDYITAIELFGYALYKSAKFEKALLCVGDGDNGKGTFLKLFERLVGLENACHVSLQDINNDKWSIANFYGKMVNTFADLPYEKIRYTGNFKMLCSGDYIRAQNKHQNPFYFSNYALMVFSTNKIPQSDDDTYAYFKRWIMFSFERNFTGPENDKNLIERMTDELPGLLNLALIGLRKLIKDNEFVHVDSIQTVAQNYQSDDPITGFIAEKCVLEQGNHVVRRDLYSAYLRHYKEHHNGSLVGSISDNMFGMELKHRGIERSRKRVKGELEYVYEGIALREETL